FSLVSHAVGCITLPHSSRTSRRYPLLAPSHRHHGHLHVPTQHAHSRLDAPTGAPAHVRTDGWLARLVVALRRPRIGLRAPDAVVHSACDAWPQMLIYPSITVAACCSYDLG
ncbi:hypothetical protein PRIPAC_86121, partial [Pristionchus pacificus]|uniref:Uncharacterized protein n=1 Tax=Pristionchus pacificus TaxID=54126 RepID=A0A2A6BUW8_PRIPA